MSQPITSEPIVLLKNLDTDKSFRKNDGTHKIEVKVDSDGGLTLGDGGLKVSDTFKDKADDAKLGNATLEAGNILKLKNAKGKDLATVDLSGLVPKKDLHVQDASINENFQLTLNTGDTNPVTVDLAKLSETQFGTSETLTITGKGTSAEPVEAEVKVDPTDNLIKKSSAGVKVAKPTVKLVDIAGNVIGYCFAEDTLN